jgi:ABC-type nitrate/sulfonate/bicarbonate transport system substrate-binding protein
MLGQRRATTSKSNNQGEDNMVFRATRRAVILGASALGVISPAAAQVLTDITMSLPSKSLVAASPRIADEMGIFAAHGLRPKFTYMDSANASTVALISRSVNIAMSGTADAVAAQARGQKVVIITNNFAGLSGTLILAKSIVDKLGVAATAPINDRLKALDGLLIASTSPTSSFTISYRSSARALQSNMRFTYMALPAMVAALESGAVQGIIATAPYWTIPVLKGSGVLWIAGPKGELPAEFTPASAADLQVMRDYAEANPAIVKAVIAVNVALQKAIDERPAEVKAAIARLYPELDAPTLDLIYGIESPAWKAPPLTAADIAHEIAYVKLAGGAASQLEGVDPASMLLP